MALVRTRRHKQRRLAQRALKPPAMIERLLGSELSIDLDDVSVGVVIIKGSPDTVVSRPPRRDAGVLKPGVGAEKIVELFALESIELSLSYWLVGIPNMLAG
jgi:hypothetical protein